jgi:hypothetical protein
MSNVHSLNVGRCIQVIALDVQGARDFCTNFFGIPADHIDRVLDAGPNRRPEKYKPEAREYHVFLVDSPKKPARFRSKR